MYKSSNFRKAQPQQDSLTTKYGPQVKQLKEAFPAWTELDLESLLVEVNGDIEIASMRIIEGHAEQWGNVTRKKDKKSSAPTSSYSKDPAAGRERGDFRGGRGGRGARGGPARGGARGGVSARGGHHDVNGHRAKPSQSADVGKDASAPDATAAPAVNGDATDADADASSAWHSSTPTTWGGDTAAVNGATSHPTPAPAPAAPAHTPAQASAQAPAPGPSATKANATPATSKLSWAQIARKPQEKPAPPPAPVPAPPPAAPSASAPTPSAPPAEPSPPAEAPEPPTTSTGWEEPTTVQAPTWDDEPRPAQPAEPAPVAEEPKPVQPEPKAVEEPAPERAAPSVSPVVPQQVSPELPAALPPKPLTPSIQARATPISHRAPKFKTTDQPVVMPASFGSGLEKIGMQFGSLSLGGEDIDSHEPAPVEQKHAPPAAPEPVAAPAPPPQESAAPVASPPVQAPLTSGSLFQNSLPQQQQQPQQPQQPAQPPHIAAQQQQPTLAASLTQPSLSAQTSLPSSTTTSVISPYSQQAQALSQQSLASHQSQQPQTQSHHAYGQHGLSTHLDQVQPQQQHAAPVSQPQQPQATQAQNLGGGPSSYFRQPEPPYFHAPTPPAGQNQDSPYGSFGQLNQQVQHQAQGSHLGNFGGADYGYGDNQRQQQQQQQQQQNFYDSYSGPTGFGNRSVLGHDDLKGLPGSQQPHAAPGLPPASAQSSQQHPPSSQASSQGQPNAGQGPQQYPPPLPYYYPYPQNQYYGQPYSSGYTVPQPFVKYPTVFQGPPGPQSAPSPATKQGPSAVQPQSPYGQGLYGQQHPSNTYDDLGYQHHAQHSVGQNVNVGSGLPSSEYGKHQSLYGSGSQGIQGFMGLGQSTGPSSGPPLGQRATGGSPEAAYKPYGGNVGVKDVGAGVGVGQAGVGVGQGPQGRGGVQQPGQGSFYAQRFAASQAGGPQGGQGQQPQGQGPQGHLGYPQGGSDGSTFYSYQPRQQQGYWQ